MNTQVNINKNGTTTLATVGKYCDRNIDVNTNVPTYEAELAEQTAREKALVDRTIVSYKNDTITEIWSYAFRDCPKLERVEFTQNVIIWNQSFTYCAVLTKFILRSESVCVLKYTGAFAYSAIANGTGFIYVPDDLVESYKTATNWSTYASQIKPISELEE